MSYRCIEKINETLIVLTTCIIGNRQVAHLDFLVKVLLLLESAAAEIGIMMRPSHLKKKSCLVADLAAQSDAELCMS